MTNDSGRLVLSGEIQLVLVYEHDDSHEPYQTVELTVMLARNNEIVAGIEGHASNGMFENAPYAIRVSLDNAGIQLGDTDEQIWGALMFPDSTPRAQIDVIRAFLRERPGIHLVDEAYNAESPAVTDNSLPRLGLGGRRLRRAS